MRIQELSWSDSPLARFHALRVLPWPLLLDSQDAGRFDILVAAPLATSWLDAEGWHHDGWPGRDGDAFTVMAALQTWARGGAQGHSADIPSVARDWPLTAGVLGYVGYAAASERGLPTRRRDDWPLAAFGWYERGCILDHRLHRCHAWAPDALPEALWQDWLTRLQAPGAQPQADAFRLVEDFRALTPASRYADDIARIHEYIRAGDCYQVNYAQAWEARFEGSLWAAYPTLRQLARAPYGAYWRLPWGEMVSLSPEQFLGIDGQRVTTRPIKGTRRRQDDPACDAAEAAALLASAKDRAENVMITDLLRNDLAKHAETGSVRVPQLCALESFGQVHHLVSTVEARLAPNAGVADLLRDAFPGGSITGAPKRRVMEIIETLEPTPRGVYCGSLVMWDARGRLDSNITIRTLVARDGLLRTWAGGGITLDSQWEAEYQECWNKMGGILRALEKF